MDDAAPTRGRATAALRRVVGALLVVGVMTVPSACGRPGPEEDVSSVPLPLGVDPGPRTQDPLPVGTLDQPMAEASDAAAEAGPAPPPPCPSAAALSLRQQLAQTLFLGVDGGSDDDVRSLVAGDEPVGGVFVRGESTTVFTSGVLLDLGEPPTAPLVAVDDEGGRVQRLDALAGDLPSAKELGVLTPPQVRALAEERGRALADVGVTVDFAPVVDLGGQADGEVIGDRAFAESADDVAADAGAFADGLRAAGVLPTLKHFPGHGRADGDSHVSRVTTPPWSELLERDVVPYRVLPEEGEVAVMVGHLDVPGLSSSPDVPSSLDPAVYDALRGEVGFEGLVVTDDLSNMRAVRDGFGQLEAARRALQAGADMALLVAPEDLGDLLDELEVEVAEGRLDEDRVVSAAGAVLRAKGC
ncbi:glycoside hydrolase family 3 N-terminal domain-containing protein [Aquipuribacter sp. MA13-6]|uniref:glycoside hydrolase family 3 N-terminal domain-containing protein n=1 Tax=unclassified Aquipuribacter TaxID=2635084 RepID=UPI003EECDA6E